MAGKIGVWITLNLKKFCLKDIVYVILLNIVRGFKRDLWGLHIISCQTGARCVSSGHTGRLTAQFTALWMSASDRRLWPCTAHSGIIIVIIIIIYTVVNEFQFTAQQTVERS